MNWYIVHVKSGKCQEIIDYLNTDQNIYAFLPKMEKWFSNSHIKEFQTSYMYPDYIFIRTSLNQEEFKMKYDDFFRSIRQMADLLEYDGMIALTSVEQMLLEKMFDNQDVIKHSTGHIVDSHLMINEGPLIGLEKRIKKIDRHKRVAILDCNIFGRIMKVPLEVISKS
ncbi:transcription termination/antitermination NusG family protein [Candidatus Stoquefichus sp. SB1]|uniref:transcription termination/antitermination NusG family protein n=1 Tax=Candidatus Stoquefichus sp. SB1 TaxID=1658109 RepID=UPI00067F6DC6|nr:transcription termination/antitermination NusG family protein [Candidatus Stoquefichus sp. SB1]